MKLILLGAPGVGKGTLASLIKKDLRIPHISTGEIFRAHIQNHTPLGIRVKNILNSGGLVGDETVIEIVKSRLEQDDCLQDYLLDGFPRTIAQAKALSLFAQPDYVINLVLHESQIVQRTSGRRLCQSCGASYHIANLPPKKENICDVCGSSLTQRIDDQPEAIKARLKTYTEQTLVLIDYYQNKGLLKNIDASFSPQEVWQSLKKILC